MDTNATLIIGALRALMAVAVAFGFDITEDQQVGILTLAGALIGVIGLGFSFWSRSQVFSKQTTERLVQEAATAGTVPAELKPPEGDSPGRVPPTTPPQGDSFRG